MELPNLAKFMDIKDRRDSLGPAKVEEMDRDNLPAKEVFFSWEKEMSLEDRKSVSKRFSRSFLVIGIVIGLIFLAMQQFFVLLIIGSLVFFIQALNKVSPEIVKYELSNRGIMIDDSIYYWDKLRRFFFMGGEDSGVIAVDTVLGFPGRVYLSFNLQDREKIKGILEKYTNYLDEEPRNVFDNTYDRVVSKFSAGEPETN